jgi:hypothetical protein
MTDECTFLNSIAIGAAGGAIAGITVYLFKAIHDISSDTIDMRNVYKWTLNEIKTNDKNNKHLSTRLIASYNNLSIDRTRYICSRHKDIYLSAGANTDIWGIYGISGRKRK